MKKFKKEYLLEELNLPENAVKDDIVDTSRWSENHDIIFKDVDEKYYRTWYSCGLTEMQDESPFEYSPDEIECVEVEWKEVTKFEWVDK